MLHIAPKNPLPSGNLSHDFNFQNQPFPQACLSPVFITDFDTQIPSFNSLALFEPSINTKRSGTFDLDQLLKKKVKPNPGVKNNEIPPLKLKDPDLSIKKVPFLISNQLAEKPSQKKGTTSSKEQKNKETSKDKPEPPQNSVQVGPGIQQKNRPHKIFKVIRHTNRDHISLPIQTKTKQKIKIEAPKINDILGFFMNNTTEAQPSISNVAQPVPSKFEEKKNIFLQSLSSDFLYQPVFAIPPFIHQDQGEKLSLPALTIPQYTESIYNEFKLKILEKSQDFKKANITIESTSSTTVSSIKSDESDISPSRRLTSHDADLSAVIVPSWLLNQNKKAEEMKIEQKAEEEEKKPQEESLLPPKNKRKVPEKIDIKSISVKSEPVKHVVEVPKIDLEEESIKINRKDLQEVIQSNLTKKTKSKSEKISPKAIQKVDLKKKKVLKKHKNRKPFVSKWDVTSMRRQNKWQQVKDEDKETSKTKHEETRAAIRPTRKAKTRVENFKKIPVGSKYQVQIPPLTPKDKKSSRSPRELKPIWNPESMKKKSLEYYFKKLEETYGFYPNEQKAIKLLRENAFMLKKVWDSIEGHEVEYARQFRLKLTRDRGLYYY